jgi:hypothetical protein
MNEKKKYIRAVTSSQKNEIMERLLAVWEAYPQLRLGQLLGNAELNQVVLYNTEDYDLIEHLEKFYAARLS